MDHVHLVIESEGTQGGSGLGGGVLPGFDGDDGGTGDVVNQRGW